MGSSFKRAIGYCEKVECEDYAKGVFLINHGKDFYCPRCRDLGKVVKEQGFTNVVDDEPFKEVRVEFNFDPVSHRFTEIGIVRDDAIPGEGSSYTLLTPMIKTEKRALKVAEAILSNLQRSLELIEGDIPRSTELLLSFDDDFDVFLAKVRKLGESLQNSNLSANRAKELQPAHI